MPEYWKTYPLLALAAFAAGIMNSIAGGGTLLKFPSLLSVVPSAVVANATSTVALVPGSLSGAWGYRSEVRHLGRWLAILIWSSVVGGGVGFRLVLYLSETCFRTGVPW